MAARSVLGKPPRAKLSDLVIEIDRKMPRKGFRRLPKDMTRQRQIMSSPVRGWLALKAAEQGSRFAQGNISAMYLKDRGVPHDFVEAHMYYNLAVSGYSASETLNRTLAEISRDSVTAKMTAGRIAKAQRLAGERLTANPKQ